MMQVSAAMVATLYTHSEVCTNGTRVFVHESIYDEFIDQLKNRTEKLITGNPMEMETQIGALISKEHLGKVLAAIDSAKDSGATLLTGGYQLKDHGLERELFVPTVFVDCTDDMPHVQDEIFGPVMSVLKFNDESEVIRRANSTDFGLAAGVFYQ